MRYRLTAVVVLAAALPVFAADPPSKPSATEAAPPAQAKSPAPGVHLTSAETERFLASLTPEQRAELTKQMNTMRAGSTCYFIRQMNHDLHQPKAVPEFVPLAQGWAPIENSDMTCLPALIIRKAGAKQADSDARSRR